MTRDGFRTKMFRMTDDAGGPLVAELRAEMARQRRKSSELAVVIGRTRQATSRRLNGSAKFSGEELIKASRWLGVSIEDLASRA